MHQLIPALSIPALSGNSWALAPVFILEVGYLKFHYQPGAAIFLTPLTTLGTFGTLLDLVSPVHDVL